MKVNNKEKEYYIDKVKAHKCQDIILKINSL